MPNTKSQSANALRSEFPLFQQRDFENLLNHAAWPVGVPSDLPEELWKRLCAASVSYEACNESVDYHKKRYLKEHTYVSGPHNRLDRSIQNAVLDGIRKRNDAIADNNRTSNNRTSETSAPIGRVIGDCTLARTHFSVSCAFSCANKGALFESLVITRMNIEQLAWICAIAKFDTAEEVIAQTSTKSLSSLKVLYPSSGEFYGWLSSHAHWKFEAHLKAFDFSSEEIATLLATREFKLVAFAALVVFYDVFLKALETIRTSPTKAEAEKPNIDVSEFTPLAMVRAIKAISPDTPEIAQLSRFLVGSKQ
jgi:hypothetical protein